MADAFNELTEFTKTGNVKYLKSAVKYLSKKYTNVDMDDKICGTCIFHMARIAKVQHLFSDSVRGPSHCFISNLLTHSYIQPKGRSPVDAEYCASCYDVEREIWVEDPEDSTNKFKLSAVSSEEFEKTFDMAKVFTEMTKFVAAVEATDDSIKKE